MRNPLKAISGLPIVWLYLLIPVGKYECYLQSHYKWHLWRLWWSCHDFNWWIFVQFNKICTLLPLVQKWDLVNLHSQRFQLNKLLILRRQRMKLPSATLKIPSRTIADALIYDMERERSRTSESLIKRNQKKSQRILVLRIRRSIICINDSMN